MKTKLKNRIALIIVSASFLVLAVSCKKEGNDPETVTDIDGNVYKTVTIGTQVWLAENLKTTKLNDGDEIPLVTGNSQWTNLTTPGYCFQDNDEATYKDDYGALYNWWAVNTNKLCPAGWHIPSSTEVSELITILGGEDLAGGALKEKGTAHWLSPNEGAINSKGFSALPGGHRYGQGGNFTSVGYEGDFWTSTVDNLPGESAWYLFLKHNVAGAYIDDQYMRDGYSVRCIKD
jgi:uncharacterized protein (TIGR02145 family)